MLAPRSGVVLRCGIAAMVEVAEGVGAPHPSQDDAQRAVDEVCGHGVESVCADAPADDAARAAYAGGVATLDRLGAWARGLKRSTVFADLYTGEGLRTESAHLAGRLRAFADAQDVRLAQAGADLPESDLELFASRVLRVRDVAWHVEKEALDLVDDVRELAGGVDATPKLLVELRRVAAVLRCINRIEIRGRDSAGIAVQVVFDDPKWYGSYLRLLSERGLGDDVQARSSLADLPAMSVAGSGDPAAGPDTARPSITFTYKVAAEVGRLGDNVSELRRQVMSDAALRLALSSPQTSLVVLGHTRWASSGVISVPNCHPVDNATYSAADADVSGPGSQRAGRIYVVMNGDVDNHLGLRNAYEKATGRCVSPRVTTDTKVVALEIERALVEGLSVADAFRTACARFDGSCAIGMVTDLEPGKLFLSLRGSGQSLYVGVSPDGFFASSEVYGLVEETGVYVKMDGESERVAGDSETTGQVILASTDGPRGRDGLIRCGFDGVALPLTEDDVRVAEITTRDVDRGDFQHFFRKEITQASRSVARTLLGRVTHLDDGRARVADALLDPCVRDRLASGAVRHVFVVGQGTAAMAGAGIAEYIRRVVPMGAVRVEATPATEMSGFRLTDDMSDTLVVAVTQSGSTADTNRAVDLARKRGALVVAIVNRRNSDITYRADSVVYTSDGRDVEMSVASTKAFYAQIVAGGLVALCIAQVLGSLDEGEIAREVAELERLPELMQRVLDGEESIRDAAERFAPLRQHWAVVASGPNHVAAREVRIKLSELCYKSIAVDTVEDKKHIDLSSEPMTLVLAAGNPEAVLNDVVKDVAIFKAHAGIPIVMCSEDERRFDPYASAVIRLPKCPPLSSMVLTALAGHLFGYHAARAIDENARFLAGVRSTLVEALEDQACRDILPETIAPARREFMERLVRDRFTSALHPTTAARISMLFDRVTGTAVPSPDDRVLLDCEDGDLVAAFVNTLGDALDQCARPIDAIKHQAKIVTVGTSRPEAELAPAFAAALQEAGIAAGDLAPVDILELHRIGRAVSAVAGLTRYDVKGLRSDGYPGNDARIQVGDRFGVARGLASRLTEWGPLVGTKRHVAAERRLFVGVGHRDGRRIAILPLVSASPGVTGLALLHLEFVTELGRAEKTRLLGARLDDVRDIVAEADREFDASMLDALSPEELVLDTARDLAGRILGEQ